MTNSRYIAVIGCVLLLLFRFPQRPNTTTYLQKRGKPFLHEAKAKYSNSNSNNTSNVTANVWTGATVQRNECSPPREGMIVSSTLGQLANNIFEIGIAKRLSEELCWNNSIVFRSLWQGTYPSSNRAAECFPNANLPVDPLEFPLPIALQEQLNFNETFWRSVVTKKGKYKEQFDILLNDLVQKDYAISLEHKPDHWINWVGEGALEQKVVERVRKNTSNVRLVHLSAFFIHTDWMRGWESRFRYWFTFDSKRCCFHDPPGDAVVIHVREFDAHERLDQDVSPYAYHQILEKYGLQERPLWIVCQPKSVNSTFVQTLAKQTKASVTIVPGEDQYDALCILTRAKTLLLTSASTFSQLGAILAGPTAAVHYPIKTIHKPAVTVSVPSWKYHLVADNADTGVSTVVRFDVPHANLAFREFQ